MTSAPSFLALSTLTCGALVGSTSVAFMPSIFAAYATPRAWLPEDEAIMPFSFSSSVMVRILFDAPLILNEPVS